MSQACCTLGRQATCGDWTCPYAVAQTATTTHVTYPTHTKFGAEFEATGALPAQGPGGDSCCVLTMQADCSQGSWCPLGLLSSSGPSGTYTVGAASYQAAAALQAQWLDNRYNPMGGPVYPFPGGSSSVPGGGGSSGGGSSGGGSSGGGSSGGGGGSCSGTMQTCPTGITPFTPSPPPKQYTQQKVVAYCQGFPFWDFQPGQANYMDPTAATPFNVFVLAFLFPCSALTGNDRGFPPCPPMSSTPQPVTVFQLNSFLWYDNQGGAQWKAAVKWLQAWRSCKTYGDRFIFVSLGGATNSEFWQPLGTLDEASLQGVVSTLVTYLSSGPDNPLAGWIDGVDFDYENTDSLSAGGAFNGLLLLANLTRMLYQTPAVTPEPGRTRLLCSHAPQPPYLYDSCCGGNSYRNLYQCVGGCIDWFNIQFYNNGIYCAGGSGFTWQKMMDSCVKGTCINGGGSETGQCFTPIPAYKLLWGQDIVDPGSGMYYNDPVGFATCCAPYPKRTQFGGMMFWDVAHNADVMTAFLQAFYAPGPVPTTASGQKLLSLGSASSGSSSAGAGAAGGGGVAVPVLATFVALFLVWAIVMTILFVKGRR